MNSINNIAFLSPAQQKLLSSFYGPKTIYPSGFDAELSSKIHPYEPPQRHVEAIEKTPQTPQDKPKEERKMNLSNLSVDVKPNNKDLDKYNQFDEELKGHLIKHRI